MSDLYGGSHESEDNISSFLQILLQNSSSAAVNRESRTASATGGAGLLSGGVTAAESSASINFSDPGGFFAGECDGMKASSSGVKYFLGSAAASEEPPDGCGFAPPPNPPPPRSSKRSRAAEVHNLSEKRRRSRINEKLKALQTLIPNSNKTDKASMLDEAIEYLKQLQLQVQMLTVRNGLSSSHPGYSLQSILTSSSGVELDEAGNLRDPNPNPNRVAETLLRDYNPTAYMQNGHETTANVGISSSLPPNFISPDSEPISAGFVQTHFEFLNHLNTTATAAATTAATSKDVCRDDTISRLQLDIGAGNSSSPGVSSSS